MFASFCQLSVFVSCVDKGAYAYTYFYMNSIIKSHSNRLYFESTEQYLNLKLTVNIFFIILLNKITDARDDAQAQSKHR